MEWSQIVWGSALLVLGVFAPGFALTLAAFPKIEQIPWAERIGISFIFGFVPSLILYFTAKNLSIKITTGSSALVMLAVIGAGVGVWMIRKKS